MMVDKSSEGRAKRKHKYIIHKYQYWNFNPIHLRFQELTLTTQKRPQPFADVAF